MPINKSRPSQEEPWENGWAPDSSRAPGTRRLWLAGGLAVATIVACVTTIALNDRPGNEKTAARQGQTLSDDETEGGGLISFATPSASTSSTPKGQQSGKSSVSPSPSASPSPSSSPGPQGSSSPGASTGPAPKPTKKPADPGTGVARRSVQAVNYPDRYWHVSQGLVRLDAPGGSQSRADSTFEVVRGLSNGSCLSFRTDDGAYLRHRNFVLRAERNDGSALFSQDATFCVSRSSYGDTVMFQSVNYPDRMLRHQNFGLRLDPYGYNTTNRQDFMFRLVGGLG
ncbi:AbfB domain-containing protein [Streptomyces sp. NPDC021608]|uniref:AbfB domain-containing protein n=1 Tax=Streptomyces sp. NPDC021608 TaxID=3154903 RepID=UPI0033C8EDB7